MKNTRALINGAVIFAAALLSFVLVCWLTRPMGIDFSVYRAGGAQLLAQPHSATSLYDHPLILLHPPEGLLFTYPTFAALIFIPMALIPQSLGAFITDMIGVAFAALLAVFAWQQMRRQPARYTPFADLSRRQLAAIAGIAFAIIWLGPWRDTFGFGQINIILMALVLFDLFAPARIWPFRGVLTGVAAGIKLTPLAFGLYFLMRKDLKGLVGLAAGFLGTIAVSFIFFPGATAQYWGHELLATNRVGGFGYIDNIALKGTLAHLMGAHAHALTPVWAACELVVIGLGAVVIFFATKCGSQVAAVSAAALVMLLVSPVSWSHHFVWIAFVWPVVFSLVFRERAGMGSTWPGLPRGVRVFGGVVLGFSLLSFYLSPKVIGFLAGMENLDSQRPGVPIILASTGTLAALLLLVTLLVALRGRWRATAARGGERADAEILLDSAQ